MQYRMSFWLEVFTTALIGLTGFGTLALILQKFDRVGGWKLGEVAFLFGTVEAAFGLMEMAFSGFDPQFFGLQVRRGAFDQLLLRPIHIVLQVMGSKFVLRRLGRILQGALIFVIALSLADIHWTLAKALYLPVVFTSLVCFFGGLFITGAAITFWTVESIEVVNILTYGGTEMMSYPMHIYQDWMRRFFTYVIPAIFLNYYPALYFLDKPDPFGLPSFVHFLSPLVGFGVLVVGLGFWNYGISHYQSTGT
jgi:ABC-2 type transport system permease protein